MLINDIFPCKINVLNMKIIRFFINRFFLSALFVLLQIAVFFYFQIFLSEYFVFFNLVSSSLGIIVFIYLINQGINPDHKIPWVVLIAIVPLFGIGLFILFSPNRVKRAHYRSYLAHIEKVRETLPFSHDMIRVRSIDLGHYYGQSEYLYRTNAFPAYSHTQTDYFASGESLFMKMKEDLRNAQSFIFLEYFIIDKGYLWGEMLEILKQKVRQGVEVRVIYDDVGTIGKLSLNYDKKLRNLGIKCVNFNRVNVFFSSIYNNRDHRKITVIDGTIGYIGGANIADEYINRKTRFGHWKDGGLRLEGEGVKAMTGMFLQMYSMHAKESEDIRPYIIRDFPYYSSQGYVQPFGDGPKPLYEYQISHTAYCHIINQAQRYVTITTPYLIIDFVMKTALINAALRGVNVVIITAGVPDKKIIYAMTRSNYPELIEAGIKIYEYQPGFIHTKMIVADDIVGIIGTINLDYRSLVHNYECGVFMYRTSALLTMRHDLEATIKKSQLQTKETARQSLPTRLVCSILNAFQTLL